MTVSEGQRIDQFFASPRPVEMTILGTLQAGFNYLECKSCGKLLEIPQVTGEIVKAWKFDLMGLKPSLLQVAKALCPVCQELYRQFSKVLHE